MTRFPIMYPGAESETTTAPKSIPWSAIAPHEARAQSNHDQSLVELARRGGLCPVELFLVVHDLSLREADRDGIDRDGRALVRELNRDGMGGVKT